MAVCILNQQSSGWWWPKGPTKSLRGCIPPKVLEVWGTIFSLMTLRKSAAQGQLTDASNCSFLVWLRAWCSSHGHVGIHGFPGSRSLDLPTGLSLTLLQGKLLGVGFDKLEPFGGWVVMLIRDWDTWASARKA